MKNIWQLIVSKPVKHDKNAKTLLFLLSFTKNQREKKFWKNILCECRRSKKVRNRGFWEYFITISTKSPPEVFYKKGVLKNFTKFRGKHLCQSLFFNKLAGLRPKALFIIVYKSQIQHYRLRIKLQSSPSKGNTRFSQEYINEILQYSYWKTREKSWQPDNGEMKWRIWNLQYSFIPMRLTKSFLKLTQRYQSRRTNLRNNQENIGMEVRPKFKSLSRKN